MKKLLIATAAMTLALALSGCSQAMASLGVTGSGSQPSHLMSDDWNSSGALVASSIISDLVKVGYCQSQQADFQTPDPATDYGKAWAADQMRSCNDYAVANASPGGCQLSYYASVGKDKLFDPKRALVYEDSMSVLLLYGQNWQLEMIPARGTQDPIKTTVANCKDYVQKLIDTIGGEVNRYGQYR